MILDKNTDSVVLSDTTDCQNVVLNFITYEEPVQTETSCLQLGLAELRFEGADLLEVEVLPITDRRLQTAWDHQLYRIRLSMTQQKFSMKIK